MSKKRWYFISFALLLSLMLAVEIYNFLYARDAVEYELFYGIATRGIGALICILMMSYCSFLHLFSSFGKFRDFCLIIPCCLIAINNFPFIPIINGTATINSEWYLVFLLALECLLVGFFEETAFRGCVFMLILERRHKNKKEVFYSIILSSLVFGGIHIVNLLAGSGIVPVILQLGYSFLIGAMCAVVLLVTKKIWIPIIIHAVFNFAGALVPTLGRGEIWDAATVTLTVVVSVVVAVYTIALFFEYDYIKIKELFVSKVK